MIDPALAGMRDALREHSFDGAVLIRRGPVSLFQAASGLASRRWNVPNTLETRFDCSSITTLFTAVAALRLAERQELDLDLPIQYWVNLESTRLDPRITLLHLLTHTSGIADTADEAAGEDHAELFRSVPNYSITSPRDQLQFFADKPPLAEPGVAARYCDAGYLLAGLVLEEVTGRGFREVIFDEVFTPAGMKDSGWYDRREAAPRVAEGWDLVAGQWVQNIYSAPPLGDPAGGAHVTASDLLNFLDALREGALLDSEHTEDFLTPQIAESENTWFGMGLEFEIRADGSLRSYYREGASPGASAILRHYVDEQIDVVVLSNTQEGAWPIIADIDSRFAD